MDIFDLDDLHQLHVTLRSHPAMGGVSEQLNRGMCNRGLKLTFSSEYDYIQGGAP